MLAEIDRLPDNVSLDLGALLEPLGVAIHASRRAKLAPGSSVLIFGAGAVGLLCAAMCMVAGSSNVSITDIQAERVEFAINNGFAHSGFVAPRNRGLSIEEKLQIAQEAAAIAVESKIAKGGSLGEFDTVFECTGIESCSQAAIYVRSEHHSTQSPSLTAAGDTPRRKGYDCRHGKPCPDIATLSSCTARGRHRGDVSICQYLPQGNRVSGEQEFETAGSAEACDPSLSWPRECPASF